MKYLFLILFFISCAPFQGTSNKECEEIIRESRELRTEYLNEIEVRDIIILKKLDKIRKLESQIDSLQKELNKIEEI